MIINNYIFIFFRSKYLNETLTPDEIAEVETLLANMSLSLAVLWPESTTNEVNSR